MHATLGREPSAAGVKCAVRRLAYAVATHI